MSSDLSDLQTVTIYDEYYQTVWYWLYIQTSSDYPTINHIATKNDIVCDYNRHGEISFKMSQELLTFILLSQKND